MNFEKLIQQNAFHSDKGGKATFEKVVANSTKKIYVIGRNEQARDLIKNYSISGLIDDYDESGLGWHGIPVFSMDNIATDSIVINCVTSISPVDVQNKLNAVGLLNVISVSDLISETGVPLDLPWFVSQQRQEVSTNRDWWAQLYNLLSDDNSKKTLADVLRFRLTANPDYMCNYSVRLRDQYFEDFMTYESEVFVDAGGFDGDTTEEFVRLYPDYKKVFFFEPSSKNLDAAKKRLVGMRDIDFRPLGLSDEEGTLQFNSNAGSASSVTQDGGGETISVVTLDKELSKESVSFIKMDLEGWEMNALRGAEEIIRKNKPKLAIAVYHSAKDFREIPQYLLSIHPGYKIFLRHYTQGWSETVMYFL